MTPSEQEQRDDECGIDLLVDGELDDARRRELLLRLDSMPGGWRRCALAFLEAQAWQDSSRACVTDRVRAEASPVAARRPSTSIFHTSWGSALALAASFIVAFGLGAWYRSNQRATDDHLAGASQPTVNPADVPEALAGANAADRAPYVTLLVDGVADGESNQVRLPVRDWSHLHQLARQPLALPETLVEQLEQSGHTVRQRRQLVPVDLRDGRQMIVPMDEVQIVPVSRAFQ